MPLFSKEAVNLPPEKQEDDEKVFSVFESKVNNKGVNSIPVSSSPGDKYIWEEDDDPPLPAA